MLVPQTPLGCLALIPTVEDTDEKAMKKVGGGEMVEVPCAVDSGLRDGYPLGVRHSLGEDVGEDHRVVAEALHWWEALDAVGYENSSTEASAHDVARTHHDVSRPHALAPLDLPAGPRLISGTTVVSLRFAHKIFPPSFLSASFTAATIADIRHHRRAYGYAIKRP